jgi:hypothetical protein
VVGEQQRRRVKKLYFHLFCPDAAAFLVASLDRTIAEEHSARKKYFSALTWSLTGIEKRIFFRIKKKLNFPMMLISFAAKKPKSTTQFPPHNTLSC